MQSPSMWENGPINNFMFYTIHNSLSKGLQ